MEKFTILTAAHNGVKFIEEAIESVVKQTYQNWEMLILDDHSTDGTYEKAKEVAEKYPNVIDRKSVV